MNTEALNKMPVTKPTLLLFSMFILAQGIQAQWNKVYEFNEEMHDMWFLNKDTGFVCGSSEYPVLMRTRDGGYTWEDITSNIQDPVYAINFRDESKGFIATWGNNKVLWGTLDSGMTWDSKFLTAPYINTILFVSPLVGYSFAGAMEYILVIKTGDGGATWHQVASFTTPAPGLGIPDACFVTEDLGYLVTNSGAVYKTTNGGWNWTSLYQSPMVYSMTGICFLNEDTGFVTGETSEYGYPEGLLLKTINGGQTWDQKYFNYPCRDIWFTHTDTGYMAANGILKTTDEGIGWVQDTCNYAVYPGKLRFPTPEIGYAMSSWPGKTILVKRDPDVGVKVNETGLAGKLCVFPVPALDQVSITFIVTADTRVVAELLNATGTQLLTMTDADYPPGNHTFHTDISSFPPGIYFVRMRTSQGVSLNKIAIL